MDFPYYQPSHEKRSYFWENSLCVLTLGQPIVIGLDSMKVCSVIQVEILGILLVRCGSLEVQEANF